MKNANDVLMKSRTDGVLREVSASLYKSMMLIRRCEERLAKSHQLGLIHGACHTYVGEEAIAAGVCGALRSDDVVFSTHRGHGHALAKGLPPRELIAELYGRSTGCSRGRGGSMHLFAPEIGLMGTSGIVGPCILQAAGAGYGFKLMNDDRVAVAFFGDGAVNNGAFHEGLNLAGIWKLPVLFICENNRFATEVPFDQAAGNPDVAGRASCYGIAGVVVDGNDVLAVREVALEAVRRARSGGGATLVECLTYRTRAHAEGMGDFTYRTRDEVEEWKRRCPIQTFRDKISSAGDHNGGNGLFINKHELNTIDDDVERLVDESHRFAESSAWPDAESATMHVFSPEPATPIREPVIAANSESREITYMKATWEALAGEMAANPRIFVLGEGIGARGGNFQTTVGLFEKYGAMRLRDTPIAERGFVGLACGAAMIGTRPVVDFMFADFVLDAVGEIVNQIAKIQYMSSGRIQMPILLRGCIGVGHSAATHHSGSYYAMYASFPGLRVVVPSTPFDAKGLLTRALRSDDPVLFLEPRELLTTKGFVPEESYEIEFGRARISRVGDHVTAVAIARMARVAIEAAEILAREGISVEVVDPRTIAPLDTDTILQSVQKTGRLIIVDETFGPFGVGAEIAARIADLGFDDLDAPVKRINGAFSPTPYSPTLERAVVPKVDDVVAAIRDLIQE